MTLKLVILLSITIAISLGAHPVEAQPANPEALARAHFKQGKAFLEAGVYDDAIKELEAGYKLSPIPDFLFNIGQAYRLAGNKVAAKQAYQRYVELTPEGDLADQSRVFIATLTKQIGDEAKASDEMNKKAAAAAELAKQAVTDATRTEHAKLDTLRKLHDDAREAQHGRRTTGKWLVAGGIVGIAVGSAIPAFGGGDNAIIGIPVAVAGLGVLIWGVLKIRANPDLGVYVAPVASGDAKGLAVGWSF